MGSCSIKKQHAVDQTYLPLNFEIKEFKGKMYVEEIFLKDTLNFSNYGTDSFYRSSPILLRGISSELEDDYRNGSFVLYKSENTLEKLKMNKIQYQNEEYLQAIVDSLSKKSESIKVRDFKLIKKFKKPKKEISFRYKEIDIKIRYVFSEYQSIWVPNFKKNSKNLIEQIKVPVYCIIDIMPSDAGK